MKIKKTKLLLAIFLLAAPLFLAGCYVPFLNKEITIPFLEKKPQTVWDLMAKKMEKTRKYREESQGRILLDFNLPKKQHSPGGRIAVIDLTYLEDYFLQGKVQAIININGKSAINQDKKESQLSFNVLFKKENNFSANLAQVSLEAKSQQKDKKVILYFKIDKLKTLFPLPNSQQFLNKWYKISGKASQGGKIDKGFNREFGKKIIAIFQKHHVFQITKRFRDQKIDGHNCYHLQVAINPKQLGAALKEVFPLIDRYLTQKGKKITSQDRENQLKMINNLTQVLSKLEGEVWIDKDSFYLRKYNFILDLKKGNFTKNGLLAQIFQYMPEAKFSFSGHLYDFGQNINITFPKNAISLDSLIPSLFPAAGPTAGEGKMGYMGNYSTPPTLGKFHAPYLKERVFNTPTSSKSTPFYPRGKKGNAVSLADYDHDGIPNFLEIKISSDPYAADTDGDGISDNQEVKKGSNLWGAGSVENPQEDPLSILSSKKVAARQAFYIFNHYLVFGQPRLALVFVPVKGVYYQGKYYKTGGLLSIWQKNGWKYWANFPSMSHYCLTQGTQEKCLFIMQPVVFQGVNFSPKGAPVRFYWQRQKGESWKLTKIEVVK